VPTIRRTRTFQATREEIWAIVFDPHHLPRWWPRVQQLRGMARLGSLMLTRASRQLDEALSGLDALVAP